MRKKIDDALFLQTWKELQSASAVAERLDMDVRTVYKKRRALESRIGCQLKANSPLSPTFTVREHTPRVDCELENGVIVVASDAHYWPGVESTAHKALVKLLPELKPSMFVMNGDAFDGAAISRFPKSAWLKLPTVKEELQAVQDRLHEIKSACPKATRTWWTMGNHDMRFEAKLAAMVPEYEGISGFCLQDHFPGWGMSISVFVNKSLMIKHRFRNGVHATWNNTLHSGVSMCTGHTHRLQATILSDYNGTRWGVDCGTLAEVDGEHMHYGEDNPVNHCSGFTVITIVDGQMIHPEFCSVVNGRAYFRGSEV